MSVGASGSFRAQAANEPEIAGSRRRATGRRVPPHGQSVGPSGASSRSQREHSSSVTASGSVDGDVSLTGHRATSIWASGRSRGRSRAYRSRSSTGRRAGSRHQARPGLQTMRCPQRAQYGTPRTTRSRASTAPPSVRSRATNSSAVSTSRPEYLCISVGSSIPRGVRSGHPAIPRCSAISASVGPWPGTSGTIPVPESPTSVAAWIVPAGGSSDPPIGNSWRSGYAYGRPTHSRPGRSSRTVSSTSGSHSASRASEPWDVRRSAVAPRWRYSTTAYGISGCTSRALAPSRRHGASTQTRASTVGSVPASGNRTRNVSPTSFW